MIVPNYIPDPLEVPANVTEQPYLIRIGFIRRVSILNIVGVAGVVALTKAPLPHLGLGVSLVSLALLLIGLDAWRVAARGKGREAQISSLLLPLVLTAVAWNLRELSAWALPAWAACAAPICVGIYALASGRDFSFVGCYALGLFASSAAVAAVSVSLGLGARASWIALGVNVALMSYLVYDLASLLSRRRVNEEIAAVTDLYRDIFNFPSYLYRVVKHWRKHKLLSLPSSFEIRWKS